MRKILDLTEMPPVYIPKRRSNLKYAFQEMTRTLRTMIYLKKLGGGSNSVTLHIPSVIP